MTTSPAFLLNTGGGQVNGTLRYLAKRASTSAAVVRITAPVCSVAIFGPQQTAVTTKVTGAIQAKEKTRSTHLAIARPSSLIPTSEYRNIQLAFRLAGISNAKRVPMTTQ